MHREHGLILLVITALPVCCAKQMGDYAAVSAISKYGFARNPEEMRQADGREVKLWGFVDHGNLYGDDGAKEILEEWWSGEGPGAGSWRFNIMAKASDGTGRSFAVHVPNDQGRDDLLKVFVADARAGRATRVFVKGRIFTFDAPTNVITLTGLYMELRSSRDILLQPPEGD
jgi:hypothetical protein